MKELKNTFNCYYNTIFGRRRNTFSKGTLPNDTSGKYGKEQSFYYTSYYQDYDVEIDFDLLPQGAFSGYDEKIKLLF